jgi:cell division protein FtsB
MAAPQDPAPRYDEQKARADRNESRVKLLTALITLVTAAAGAFAVIGGQAAKKVDVSADQVKQLQAQNRDLESQLTAARKTIEQLRDSRDVVPPGSGDADIRHEGSFTLLARKAADLDTPDTDPQWGIVRDSGTTDIEWRPYENMTIGRPFTGAGAVPTQLKFVGSTEPTEDDCRGITDYSGSEIELAKVKVGTFFCWITSEQRYAVLKVTALGKEFSSVTLHAKVFKKGGD